VSGSQNWGAFFESGCKGTAFFSIDQIFCKKNANIFNFAQFNAAKIGNTSPRVLKFFARKMQTFLILSHFT